MAQLPALILRYRERLERVMKEPIKATATKVDVRSPVDTGFFRGNWESSVNGSDRGGISSAVAAMKIGDVFKHSNDADYGPKLEYEGHSSQAPNGMVRISAAEWEDEVRTAINGS